MTTHRGERASFYICHYTTAANAMSILTEGRLRFSTLSRCNDPRETYLWNFSLAFGRDGGDAPGQHRLDISELADISEQTTRLL